MAKSQQSQFGAFYITITIFSYNFFSNNKMTITTVIIIKNYVSKVMCNLNFEYIYRERESSLVIEYCFPMATSKYEAAKLS